jgi:hypothetical protein
MNFLFNTFDQLEPLETFVFTDAAQTLTVTKQSGTFAAGAYVLRFKKGDLTLEDVALTYAANALTASNALDFLALEFELSRQNRVTLTCALLKGGAAYGGEGSFAAKNETEAVDFDPQLPVTRYESDSTLAEPTNFFTANASGIWDAISGLVEVPDTFDASTALHLGTTTGNLAGTSTIQDLADALDALTLAQEFDPESAAHGGTTTGNLTGTSTVADMADKLDALTLSAASTKEFCLPFSYMDQTKCFSAGTIGWGTLEFTAPYYGSAGGYVSASATLQNGTSYILIRLPPSANNFRELKALDLGFFATSVTSTDTKLDITVYGVTSSASGKFAIWSQAGYTVGANNVPTGFSINRSALTNIFETVEGWNEANHRAIVIEIESYSRNNHYTFVTHGAVNLLG